MCCRKELAFSKKKGNTEAKKYGIKGLSVSCFPPVCVSNLYRGQCFIQIVLTKLNVHLFALQSGSVLPISGQLNSFLVINIMANI